MTQKVMNILGIIFMNF
uniref:Uncharacterized protein n=1 Tax=Anguilla anguilla TaxID=7936 RepID=A0A0E9SWY0_ANGAN